MDSVFAYLPLLTLLQLLDNLILRYKYKLNFIDQQQIGSLEGQVHNFLDILESRPPGPHDPQMQPFVLTIRDSVVEVCQVIDDHVVDQIRGEADIEEDEGDKWISAFRKDMSKVIRDLESIIKVTCFNLELVTLTPESQRPLIHVDPSSSNSTLKSGDQKVIGFDHHISFLKDEFIFSHVKRCEVIPIVGMGGIGKTTLARFVYEDPYIQRQFDKRYWVTISQEYDLLRMLQGILENKECQSVIDLGTKLYQKLKGYRYLIVLDDMWDKTAWEKLRQYFPEDNKGSRIIVTTRDRDLADGLGSSKTRDMGFLSKRESWELFCDRVFGGIRCPGELQNLGWEIVNNCRGLPLGIITAAGLLSKSNMTPEYWRLVSENVAGLVNLQDDEYCRKVLRMSYDYLPLHLKPLFFYIVEFYEEDEYISIDELIKSLVVSALVRPIGNKPIQQIAKDCVEELFQRNLIFIQSRNRIGDIERLGIHDLLRDLYLKEIRNEKLFSRRFIEPGECTKRILRSKGSFYQARDADGISSLCGSCREETSLFSIFWNIKDFSVDNDMISEIWKSPQIAYVELGSETFPMNDRKHPIIFERLIHLSAKAGEWTKYIASSMPNLKNLYLDGSTIVTLPPALECLWLEKAWDIKSDILPKSLREIHLYDCEISCRQLNGFGSLPKLEILTVLNTRGSDDDDVLEPIKGVFHQLKLLAISGPLFGYWWTVSDVEFPQLEILSIRGEFVREIPLGLINETLNSIYLEGCVKKLNSIGRQILKEQRILGNDTLRLFIDGKEPDDGDDEGEYDDGDGNVKSCLQKAIGFEHHNSWMKDELIDFHEKELKLLCIVGDKGVGKTTFARVVYEDTSVQWRFNRRYWVSMPREFDLLRMLQDILDDKHCNSISELGIRLNQKFKGHRYLIVLDDIQLQGFRTWEDLTRYFPDDSKGSRIIMTTRDSQLADGKRSSKTYHMSFLDEEEICGLLSDRVFLGMCCPREVEICLRQIVEQCHGFPLGNITIAGLFPKWVEIRDYWIWVSEISRWEKISECWSCVSEIGLIDLDYKCSRMLLELCLDNEVMKDRMMCNIKVTMMRLEMIRKKSSDDEEEEDDDYSIKDEYDNEKDGGENAREVGNNKGEDDNYEGEYEND